MTMLGLCLSRYVHNGLVAQLGERCVRNAEVTGSNPAISIHRQYWFKRCFLYFFLAKYSSAYRQFHDSPLLQSPLK